LFNNHAEQSSNSWAGNTAYAEGSATAVEGGSLNSSEVTVLSSEPSINRPNALSESDVGRFAQ